MVAAMLWLVLVPLVAALAALVAPAPARRWIALIATLAWPLALPALLGQLATGVAPGLVFGGWPVPLGIVWRFDGWSLVLVLVHAAVALAALPAAWRQFAPGAPSAATFWPLWLVLGAGVNLAVLAADLFNLYVTLELTTLAGVALIAAEGSIAALVAAMRYLLLAVLGSLIYLMGVGLVYAETGSLALAALDALPATPMALMLTGLMVKAAVFPLHVWLPAAYGNAPGPVAALLSAVVGKIALVATWRIWLAAGGDHAPAAWVLGGIGALALFYGAMMAYLEPRLKTVIAWSSVSQIGLMLLLIPLAGLAAVQGAGFLMLAHGLATAAMFLAAANIVATLGSDSIRHLPGLDKRMPVEAFTLALAGVTLIGLPPSGGFVAKWMLLRAAWEVQSLVWMATIALSGLASAGYVFRILALTCFHPARRAVHHLHPRPQRLLSLAALGLALVAVVIGLMPHPLLDLLDRVSPGGLP